MMSHRITSAWIWPGPRGLSTLTLFFVIFVPSVATYRSSYWSSTYRRISDVLPTAPSPAMQILSLTTSPAAIIGPRPPPALPRVAPRGVPVHPVELRLEPPRAGILWIDPEHV